jgi:hypothetical protein
MWYETSMEVVHTKYVALNIVTLDRDNVDADLFMHYTVHVFYQIQGTPDGK